MKTIMAEIRTMKARDIPECYQILCGHEAINEEFLSENYLEDIFFHSDICMVYVINERVVGCIFSEEIAGKIVLLDYIASLPVKKNIATDLLKTFELGCKIRGNTCIIANGLSTNLINVSFWKRNNYENDKLTYYEWSKII